VIKTEGREEGQRIERRSREESGKENDFKS
jgi:hypothetical protein